MTRRELREQIFKLLFGVEFHDRQELPEQIAVGVSVKAGDVIGNVGETASVEVADEAHLHLEMTEKGLQVDPTKYLDADALATLHEDTNFEDES